jgi:hypothetical protein
LCSGGFCAAPDARARHRRDRPISKPHVTAAIALLFKAVIIPVALHRLVVRLGIHRPLETVVGVGLTMLAGMGLVALAMVVMLPASADAARSAAALRRVTIIKRSNHTLGVGANVVREPEQTHQTDANQTAFVSQVLAVRRTEARHAAARAPRRARRPRRNQTRASSCATKNTPKPA